MEKRQETKFAKNKWLQKGLLATFLKDKDIDQGLSKQKQVHTSSLDSVDEALLKYLVDTTSGMKI